MNIRYVFIALYVLWNFIVFLFYGIDKLKSKRDAWRIPEKTLLLMAFIFGGIGADLGMTFFRHKTKHKNFKILVPFFSVLNIITIVLLFKFVF